MGEYILSIGDFYFFYALLLGYIWVPIGFLYVLFLIAYDRYSAHSFRKEGRQPRRVVSRGVRVGMAVHWALTILPPSTVMIYLYVLAYRAKAILGYWPQPMVDDPKRIAGQDNSFPQLYDFIWCRVLPCAGLAMIAWMGFMIALLPYYTRNQKRTVLLVYMAIGLLFRFDSNLRWYLD